MIFGIICEGAYTDKPVIKKILEHNFPHSKFEIIARDKKAIFLPCFQDINDLIGRGVTQIVILWDLLPVGQKMAVSSQWSEKPNRMEQRKMLIAKLIESEDLNLQAKKCMENMYVRYGFHEKHVYKHSIIDIRLVCVCYTLDGWLLSDEQTIKRLGSTPAHKIKYLTPSLDMPDLCTKPVEQLTKIFKSCANRYYKYYNKHEHNKDIVQAYIDHDRLDRMRVSTSYTRLIDTLSNWGAI